MPFFISLVSATAAFMLRMGMPEPAEFVRAREHASGSEDSTTAEHHSKPDGRDASPAASAAADAAVFVPSTPVAAASNGGALPGGEQPGSPKNAGRRRRRTYVPLLLLFRRHILGVMLQFLLEAWVSIGFWLTASWLPVQLRKPPVLMPEILTQAMLLVNFGAMIVGQLAAGAISDRGLPRLWMCLAVHAAAAGACFPLFAYGFQHAAGGIAGAWLMHSALMVVMGLVLGLIPCACVRLRLALPCFLSSLPVLAANPPTTLSSCPYISQATPSTNPTWSCMSHTTLYIFANSRPAVPLPFPCSVLFSCFCSHVQCNLSTHSEGHRLQPGAQYGHVLAWRCEPHDCHCNRHGNWPQRSGRVGRAYRRQRSCECYCVCWPDLLRSPGQWRGLAAWTAA